MGKAKEMFTRAKAKAETAVTIAKPAIPSSGKLGFYQTLFRKLLAEIPSDMRKDPAAYVQIKMLNTAVNGLTEENAARIAMHIKLFGVAIVQVEREHGIDPFPNAKPDGNEAQTNNSEANNAA